MFGVDAGVGFDFCSLCVLLVLCSLISFHFLFVVILGLTFSTFVKHRLLFLVYFVVASQLVSWILANLSKF